jgi:hypothetical protein
MFVSDSYVAFGDNIHANKHIKILVFKSKTSTSMRIELRFPRFDFNVKALMFI